MKPKNYYIGCSGWYYDHWKNRFYPEDLKKSDWLTYYGEHFNTVEINSTFYRFPTEKLLTTWYKKTPEDFIFTLKVNQIITHRKKFKDTKDLLKRFYKISGILENKLGCILFQIPPNITKNMDFLANIVNQLDSDKKNVIEFRDISWFHEDVYQFLTDNNLNFCTVSAPDLPDNLVTTYSLAYIRFHGIEDKYQHLYSIDELEEWAQKIQNLNADEIFCYFNNDYEANAIKNCKQLKKILKIS